MREFKPEEAKHMWTLLDRINMIIWDDLWAIKATPLHKEILEVLEEWADKY